MNLNKIGPSLSSLILRVCLGGLIFVGHGLPKLNSLLSGGNPNFPDPLGLGSQISQYLACGAEVGCAFLILLGLKTRLSVIPLITTCLVAAFSVHSRAPFFPIFLSQTPSNYSYVLSPFKEYPILYAIGFIALFFLGGGRYAVDHWLKKH